MVVGGMGGLQDMLGDLHTSLLQISMTHGSLCSMFYKAIVVALRLDKVRAHKWHCGSLGNGRASDHAWLSTYQSITHILDKQGLVFHVLQSNSCRLFYKENEF